jgi:hypothetical protein
LKLPIVSEHGLEEFGDALTTDATSGCSGKVILVSLEHRSYSLSGCDKAVNALNNAVKLEFNIIDWRILKGTRQP